MLRDLVRKNVQVVRDALGVLCFLEVSRGARAELEAGREAREIGLAEKRKSASATSPVSAFFR